MNEAFWKMLDDMVREHKAVIDRPKGSRHPKYPNIIYPLDYGYLEGTSAMDGSGIDLWMGSREERRAEGIICTIDRLKGDSEIKLLLACTEEEMRIAEEFHNASEYMKGLLIRREG